MFKGLKYSQGEFSNYEPSGYYMYHQFNIQQFYVLPTQCIYVFFLWISEQTAIISLYGINCLVFITETECVYCAVGAEYLIVIHFNPLISLLPCQYQSTNSPHSSSFTWCSEQEQKTAKRENLQKVMLFRILVSNRWERTAVTPSSVTEQYLGQNSILSNGSQRWRVIQWEG